MGNIGRQREEAGDKRLVGITSVTGILACVGDVVMTHLLGAWSPGYRPLSQPMSDLGDVGSPVARLSSTWWSIMGLLFITFGYGFYRAFSHCGRRGKTAACMIALYGVGEGVGSGLASRTPGKPFLAPASVIHNLSGTAGVAAAVLLPFIIMKMYEARRAPYLYWYSWLTSITGVLFLAVFSIGFLFRPEGGWISYTGLWQRLFMVTYYLYFVCMAVLMLKRREPTS